mgnify:CR=1 FL=1
METVLERYRRQHAKSAELYRQAQKVFPDGVTHDTRYLLPFPVFITHAQGSRKWDVDGNEYVDYVMGHGALLLGHSHPEIVAAVAAQVARGTHLGGNTELELRWAEWVRRLIPSAEKVRFTSSGTEATLMAMRLSRAFTGKSKVIKFTEHFHGWNDYALAGAMRGGGGIPSATWSSMVVLPPNDISLVEKTLKEDRDMAAVILEPTGAHFGRLPVYPQFLKDLGEVTRRYGVLLIFDEVVTGFRTSSGGAQARYGVRPDLTTMAKILGGGLPGGAVAGRADVLDMIAHKEEPGWEQKRRVSHPGTFNANPLSAAAGSKCLEIVATQEPNGQADRMAQRLKDGINQVLARLEISGHARGVASVVHLDLGTDCACDREVCTLPHERLSPPGPRAMALKRALLNAGVDLMGRGDFIVSAVHREGDIDRTIEGVEEALGALRGEGVV